MVSKSSTTAEGHPSRPNALRLYGRRVMLRPLVAPDFASWSEIRRRNHDWLTVWEPAKTSFSPDPSADREAFAARCNMRDRDRQSGVGYSFGLFVDNNLAGEVNLNNVVRGALQTGTIGYWIDQAKAGRGYVAEDIIGMRR